MNCRNSPFVLNDKVIYYCPHDFIACWKQGERLISRRSLRRNWSNFTLGPPCTQWKPCDWSLVTLVSQIYGYTSDLPTWVALSISDASLITIIENKVLKNSNCHVQNSYLLNKLRLFVYLLTCVTSSFYLKRSQSHCCLTGSPVSHVIIAYCRKVKNLEFVAALNCVVFILNFEV